MNKELIEMMGKMMEQMNEMQSEMKNGFSAVNERIDGLDSKIDTGFNSMKEMLYGIGKQFELGTEQKDANIDEIKQDLKFVTHKLNSVEKDVFNLGGRQ